MRIRTRHSSACSPDAELLAYPSEVEAQIEQEDKEIEEEEIRKSQEDSNYQYSPQSSVEFWSSQSSDLSSYNSKSKGKHAIEDKDNDGYDTDHSGGEWRDDFSSSLASLGINDGDTAKDYSAKSEQEPDRAKTPLFLPSSQEYLDNDTPIDQPTNTFDDDKKAKTPLFLPFSSQGYLGNDTMTRTESVQTPKRGGAPLFLPDPS